MNIVYIIFAAIKVQIAVTVHIACIANTVRPCNSYGGIGSIHIDFTVTEGYVYAWEGFADTGRITMSLRPRLWEPARMVLMSGQGWEVYFARSRSLEGMR